jgi:hypothetical protein
MANPNLANVASTYANLTYLIPTGTSATTWTALTPSTNQVNKIDCITASNVTGSTATITVSINSATGGGGTAYRVAYQISVPANSTLVITDKSTSFYVGEAQSVVVTAGTASAIEMVASYETIA